MRHAAEDCVSIRAAGAQLLSSAQAYLCRYHLGQQIRVAASPDMRGPKGGLVVNSWRAGVGHFSRAPKPDIAGKDL